VPKLSWGFRQLNAQGLRPARATPGASFERQEQPGRAWTALAKRINLRNVAESKTFKVKLIYYIAKF
jgi:hypothetical protein